MLFAFLATFMMALITRFYATDKTFSLFSFINLFINLSLTIIIASYMFLSIFKDLSAQSVDIITFTKPYSRQYFIATKILFLICFGAFWSFFLWILLTLFYLINYQYFNQVNKLFLWGFISPFFSFVIFGTITALISYKFSSKLSLSITIFAFSPLILIGSSSAFSSTSPINRFAEILNLEHEGYDSKTIADVEKFYLNDKKDRFFIIPKQVDNPNFTERQIKYLQSAWNDSTAAAQVWQAASYLLIPYQLINIFEKNDRDAIENAVANKPNFLQPYIYNNNLASKGKSYILSPNSGLKKFKLSSGKSVFLVPGALKNDSHFSNLENREIIYANTNAGNFNILLPQDSQTFGLSSDLVGKLRWNFIKEILLSQKFNDFAINFFSKLPKEIDQKIILGKISEAISTNKELLEIDDETTTVFQKNVHSSKIANETQRKIYLAAALIYWIYFNKQDEKILDALLKNEKNNYDPAAFFVQIDKQNYQIGGFSSFNPEQRVVNEKVINRFNLTKSNNFLFQPALQIMEVKENYQVVKKWLYPLIWLSFSAILLYLTFRFYSRRDYL
ncbi:ABC transporter permease [Mycoplasma sp. 'Moose RK']|uniref:ABC transporter permease n=1 Tax=Mycoplasma sp. 'Moose RK' TaxID=2780095 RepID=UPI001E522995|nr:ABC transporter permease [Mycoplasma sp. 'Moose RK']